MASQLKVDEITTVSGTGTLKIAGNVQVNAADNTSGIVLPNGTEAQRATAPPHSPGSGPRNPER